MVYSSRYCAQAELLTNKVSFTAGIVAQPTVSAMSTGITLTIISQYGTNSPARCIVLPAGASPAPTASAVLTGTGAHGTSPTATTSQTTAYPVAYVGLLSAASYKAYCAQSGVLTSSAAFTPGIRTHPAVTISSPSAVSLSTLFTATADARCVVVAKDGTAPTSVQVLAGSPNAVSSPAAALATGGQAFAVTYGSLTLGTQYDAYVTATYHRVLFPETRT